MPRRGADYIRSQIYTTPSTWVPGSDGIVEMPVHDVWYVVCGPVAEGRVYDVMELWIWNATTTAEAYSLRQVKDNGAGAVFNFMGRGIMTAGTVRKYPHDTPFLFGATDHFDSLNFTMEAGDIIEVAYNTLAEGAKPVARVSYMERRQ